MTTCPDCHGTGLVHFEDHDLPCPFCRPAAAREACHIFDPQAGAEVALELNPDGSQTLYLEEEL